jgi:twitching motility protein PilU
MEKSMAVGSQMFEEHIAQLILDGVIDRSEGLAHADSPTNLMWRLQNNAANPSPAASAAALAQAEEDASDEAKFTEFTLDVTH